MIDISRQSRVAVLLVAAALAAAGCDQRNSFDTVGQTVGGAVDRIAGKADAAARGTDVSVEDAELAAKVGAAIFAEPDLQSQHIDVDTHDSVVTLGGTVDAPSLRERAIEIAGAVEGVLEVRDKLEVSP
jgi:osmotically-inducible protein OsmY